MENAFDLTFKAEWDEIEKVRERGSKFLKNHGFSSDVINSLIMVISELIENSIKYGNFKKPNNKVNVILNITKNLLTIEVNNPVDKNTTSDY